MGNPGDHSDLQGLVFPQDGEVYESLLATADSRMYQDKAARKRAIGRDRAPAEEALHVSLADLSESELQRAATGVI